MCNENFPKQLRIDKIGKAQLGVGDWIMKNLVYLKNVIYIETT